MKNIKKLLGWVAMTFVFCGGGVFVSCSDNTEEDDELVVGFSESGTTEKTITMTVPEKYDGYEVHIAFTIDGSTPDVKFDSTAYNTVVEEEGSNNTDKILSRYLEYFDYGTADIYSSDNKPKFDTSVTINAIAFYVNPKGDDGKPKAVKGSSAQSYEVKIEGTEVTATPVASNANGGTFKLAKNGNTNMIHYFDMSNALFNSGSYKNCYYQIQFSYKGSGKGNWYLYVRQAGTGTLVNPSVFGVTTTTSKYIASGTYTGACFDDSHGQVADGTLSLRRGTSSEEWKSVSVTVSGDSASFELETDNALSSDAK